MIHSWPLLCDLFRHAQRNTHKHILCKGVKGPMVNLVRTRGNLSVFEQTASNNPWPPDITFLFFTKTTENISGWEHEAFFSITEWIFTLYPSTYFRPRFHNIYFSAFPVSLQPSYSLGFYHWDFWCSRNTREIQRECWVAVKIHDSLSYLLICCSSILLTNLPPVG